MKSIWGKTGASVLLGAAIASGVTGCFCKGLKRRSRPNLTPAQANKKLEQWRKRLGDTAEGLPPPGDGQQACPTSIDVEGKGRFSLPIMDEELLLQIKRGPLASIPPDWGFLTSNPVESLAQLGPSDSIRKKNSMLHYLRGYEEKRYVGVIRADKRMLPRMRGSMFVGGFVGGSLELVHLQTNSRLCYVRFFARSGKKVTFRSRGAFKSSRDKALRSDFAGRVGTSLRKALRKIVDHKITLSAYHSVGKAR